MYRRACAHACCTNDSSTVHSLYNVLCFLYYQLPYRAQYLQSTDCLLRPCSRLPQATRACHRFGVVQGACSVQWSKYLTTTEPQYGFFTTMKTSNTTQTFRVATYKTTAHRRCVNVQFNPLKPELNPICYLLALLAHHFLHVSRIRVKSLTFRRLMSYIHIYIYIYIYIYIWSTHSWCF